MLNKKEKQLVKEFATKLVEKRPTNEARYDDLAYSQQPKEKSLTKTFMTFKHGAYQTSFTDAVRKMRGVAKEEGFTAKEVMAYLVDLLKDEFKTIV